MLWLPSKRLTSLDLFQGGRQNQEYLCMNAMLLSFIMAAAFVKNSACTSTLAKPLGSPSDPYVTRENSVSHTGF